MSFFRYFIVLAVAWSAAGTLGADPTSVGGTTLKIEKLTIQVPGGWFRAEPEMESAEEAFIFFYLKSDQPDDDAEVRSMVRIEKLIDEFASGAEIPAFYAQVEKNLTASGWKKGQVRVNGKPLACYMDPNGEEETTYLVQLPLGAVSITTYTVVPRKGAGFPKAALTFLENIESHP
jgi:hypothetical protein